MSDVVQALANAFRSVLHPRMLALTIWPMLVALVLWIGLACGTGTLGRGGWNPR